MMMLFRISVQLSVEPLITTSSVTPSTLEQLPATTSLLNYRAYQT